LRLLAPSIVLSVRALPRKAAASSLSFCLNKHTTTNQPTQLDLGLQLINKNLSLKALVDSTQTFDSNFVYANIASALGEFGAESLSRECFEKGVLIKAAN
jgi:hypothetical protein